MASVVTTNSTAEHAAYQYLATHHPVLMGVELAVLQLESGWLVEAVPSDPPGTPPGRILMIVNRHGFVEEIGPATVTRQHAQRSLASVQNIIQL
jgi:hypothetical protein